MCKNLTLEILWLQIFHEKYHHTCCLACQKWFQSLKHIHDSLDIKPRYHPLVQVDLLLNILITLPNGHNFGRNYGITASDYMSILCWNSRGPSGARGDIHVCRTTTKRAKRMRNQYENLALPHQNTFPTARRSHRFSESPTYCAWGGSILLCVWLRLLKKVGRPMLVCTGNESFYVL